MYFFETAISILVISKHNSFRMLLEKNCFGVYYWTIYLYFSIGNGQPREPALCQLHRHTFVRYTTVAERTDSESGRAVLLAEFRPPIGHVRVVLVEKRLGTYKNKKRNIFGSIGLESACTLGSVVCSDSG